MRILDALDRRLMRIVDHSHRLHVGQVPDADGAVKRHGCEHVVLEESQACHASLVVLWEWYREKDATFEDTGVSFEETQIPA